MKALKTIKKQQVELPDKYKEARSFSLHGSKIKAFVHKVYDGDTFHACFEFKGDPYYQSFRLLGFDAPEMKLPKNNGLCSEDLCILQDNAQKAKMMAAKYMLGREVDIDCQQNDKYGRTLCNVSTINPDNGDVIDVSTALLESKVVFPYLGQTKMTLSDQVNWLKQYVQ